MLASRRAFSQRRIYFPAAPSVRCPEGIKPQPPTNTIANTRCYKPYSQVISDSISLRHTQLVSARQYLHLVIDTNGKSKFTAFAQIFCCVPPTTPTTHPSWSKDFIRSRQSLVLLKITMQWYYHKCHPEEKPSLFRHGNLAEAPIRTRSLFRVLLCRTKITFSLRCQAQYTNEILLQNKYSCVLQTILSQGRFREIATAKQNQLCFAMT